jgi:type IV pilus assembly protein PilQ
MDVPPTQVVIEAMILSVKLTDTMEFGVNFALLNGPNNQLVVSGNGAALATGSGFPGTSGAEIVPPLGQFVQNTAGLKYGIIRGDLSGFISALETLADTNLIATPQLMVLNKQKAELIIGNRLSYSTAVFNGTQSIQNVNFIEAGTKLILRPFIAPDGLVRMEVHPERSAAVIDSKTGLPNLTTTEVTTNVMVRDGTTVVIGGLIEETASDSQSRIPLFGALPWVGPLFRNKSERTDRTELIVLITPRIVQEPLAAADGESARFENERRAEHFRDSLTPINRRNLTRIHTERARYYFERGELEKARRQIAAAVLQNPNDRQALRLRDQIDAAIANRNRQWVRLPGFSRGPAPVPVESEPPIEQLPPPNQTANQPSPP